jgi:H+-transporting ATPase
MIPLTPTITVLHCLTKLRIAVIVIVHYVFNLLFSFLKGIDVIALLPLATALLVSAIPVALPAMFTITMAFGSKELAKKGVLVTRLSASEDAATMSTLCVDKTGTLTSNNLSVTDVLEMGIYKKEDVIRYGTLSSNEADQDPIDMALITAAKEKHIDTSTYVQKKFVPFNPLTRRTEALIENDDGKKFYVTKGALSVVLPLCGTKDDNDSPIIRSIEEKTKEFASRGYKTLAVAVGGLEEKPNKKDLIGIVALYDKPRSDSATLIDELKELGISIKMLTGDSLPIAREIARQTNLGDRMKNMSELRDLIKSDTKRAAEIAKNSDGFAEVYPEDKYLMVKTLQSENMVVGMTGDGVNDAPALKQAEVGIAVSNAADVAKGAASVVLTKEGLSNIVDLIKTGRMIYERIITWTFNKIIKTFQIAVFVVLAFLLTGHNVVGTFEIILLLFFIDFVTLSISTDNVRWSKSPDTWNIKSLFKVAVIIGTAIVIESLGLLYIGTYYLGLSYQLSNLHTDMIR